MKWITTPLSVAVHLDDQNPVFGEGSTHVCIDDEAGGPFIILKQSHDGADPGETRFDLEELQHVARVAAELIAAYPKEQA